MTAPKQISNRAWLVSGLAVLCSAVIASVTPIHHRIEFWLRGSALIAYQGLFLVGLFLAGTILARRFQSRPSVLPLILWGTAVGYLAGLFALLFHPLALSGGVRLFRDSLHITRLEALVALLWFPIRLLSWLLGAMTGLFIGILLRIFDRDRT